MTENRNHRKIGTVYEQKAVLFLQENGYQVIETNYYCRHGEIDIVAKDGKYLVFVEVKYRKNSRMGNPWESVTVSKQRKLCKSALWYLVQHGYGEEQPCRFDVIGIEQHMIKIIKDAFSFFY